MKKISKIIVGMGIVLLIFIFLPHLFLSVVYYSEMRPHVAVELDNFEEKLSKITDNRTKISEIANFTVSNYYQTYSNEAIFPPIFSILWGYEIFGNISNPRIKPLLYFSNDPYFIACFKTGACGESAVLFDFYANRSKFESRIVGTKAEDHQWNEVKINDTWIQVDPTIYYYFYNYPSNYSNYAELWAENPEAYNILGWYGGYSKITVIDTNEDLTEKYCNTSNLSIFCENCERIKIKPE